MAKDRRKRRARPTPSTCPCGTGSSYEACCGGLHEGARTASDPIELMRSRYSALCVGRGDYLWQTLHSSHEDRAQGAEAFAASAERSSGSVRYRKLRVLDTRPADPQGIAQVLFHADIAQLGRDRSVVELSSFAEEDGQWRYLSGTVRRTRDLSHGPTELSIDHWDCGHDH